MTETKIISWITLCPTRRAGSRRQNSHVAFVNSILGAQVNMRSTIIGDGGRANEAQSEFLTLVENAIKQPDLAKSAQRYQLALDETKPRVNIAVIPGGWLHDVYENGDKHRNSGRLQQQNHAGNTRHKARDKQRRKHRDKKSRASSHRRRSVKN